MLISISFIGSNDGLVSGSSLMRMKESHQRINEMMRSKEHHWKIHDILNRPIMRLMTKQLKKALKEKKLNS